MPKLPVVSGSEAIQRKTVIPTQVGIHFSKLLWIPALACAERSRSMRGSDANQGEEQKSPSFSRRELGALPLS